jgi:hypothetical protein
MDSWVPKENFDGTNMIWEHEKRKGEHHSKKIVGVKRFPKYLEYVQRSFMLVEPTL